MDKNIDIFKLHSSIMEDYKEYISSFININDERIKNTVEAEINEGHFWPDPLIQFNPAYEVGASIDDSVDRGILNPGLLDVFKGYSLYKHQIQALELGNAGRDFVVTSGTGSGKSLTYMGTIFNYLFANQNLGKGVKAVIVYPMNALINSQYEEIEKYRKNYEALPGNTFPVIFKKYTGQEDISQKSAVKDAEPDIILTNYMMLELIMTRYQEMDLCDSIYRNLKYLVFDELHTYRGRQGADVALLIRRIKACCKKEIQCFGTSATMVSGGTITEQKEDVAEIASKIFGKPFSSEQIINESLVSSFSEEYREISGSELANELEKEICSDNEDSVLKKNLLANWLEIQIALEYRDGIWFRRKPMTVTEIASELSMASGKPNTLCLKRLEELLDWINDINIRNEGRTRNYLPYKIHQFISQTGAVYMTLGKDDDRNISLEPVVRKKEGEGTVPYYPVVFSRSSGYEFYSVSLEPGEQIIHPRDMDEPLLDDDEETEGFSGYILPYDDVWNPNEDYENLPETWFKKDKNNNIRMLGNEPEPDKNYKALFPVRIFYNRQGNFSFNTDLGFSGWFMKSPLLFDPTSGTIFDKRTRDRTKLSRLGNEGRSTSTTILSLSILKQLNKAGIASNNRKLLSFTDNRQDASLQAGHFNDFIKLTTIRRAVNKALEKHGEIDFTSFDGAVFESINLSEEEYAVNPADSDFIIGNRLSDNAKALKVLLMYLALEDLKRGWRITLPNLEMCGLLEFKYKDFDEFVEMSKPWEDIPLINKCGIEKRKEIIYNLLEYFRKSYAIRSELFLTSDAIERNEKSIKEKLRSPWSLDSEEHIKRPNYMRFKTVGKKISRMYYTESIGHLSVFGKYVRDEARDAGTPFNKSEYSDFIEKLLDKLCGAGWLNKESVKDNDEKPSGLYQLDLSSIIWCHRDGQEIKPDPVRSKGYKNVKQTPNQFFMKLYSEDDALFKGLDGREHTGQMSNEVRIDREEKFRAGSINALFCSPTMELGIDISELNIVHMRNVPPSPANYAQRSGRAGRSGQAALVFTNCSRFSPHDNNYFRNSKDMVAGSVQVPQIELANKELLSSHLNAVVLSMKRIPTLKESIKTLMNDNDELSLQEVVKDSLYLTDTEKGKIKSLFINIISDFSENELAETEWFNEEWIIGLINSVSREFDNSFNRWRRMYQQVQTSIREANSIIESGRYKKSSDISKDANRKLKLAQNERSLLCNESNGYSFSEFYPFRYLAAEGFLPGYNFTRLPIRAYIPSGEDGQYVSRPRFVALREFGPQNVIYHNGEKFQVNQIVLTENEEVLERAKICPDSGYFMTGNEFDCSVSPFNQVALEGKNGPDFISNMIEMRETRTRSRERISCEEEVRVNYGYSIETYFSVPAGMATAKSATIKHEGVEYLKIQYLPACKLHQVNRKWMSAKEEGFLLGLSTGFWKNKAKKEGDEISKEENRQVTLTTHDTADALYIQPIKTLNLDSDGVITLQYALKRAVENYFHAESREIGVTQMGANPNIMLYEASEGSLGILSRFVSSQKVFGEVIREAWKTCRFDDEDYVDLASYKDLLSYYNQRHHEKINRFLIKDALTVLGQCEVELESGSNIKDYDEQYHKLLKKADKNSAVEFKLLNYLYENGLRLPDDAQKNVPGVYCKPDFFYEPDCYIFCDGSVHEIEEIADNDMSQREAVLNAGFQYLVYDYQDDLETFVNRRNDIFRKVK